MADRPDETLEWATSGTNVIAPSSGKKISGWLPGEQPPAAWWNWYKNLGGRWVQYLDEQRAAVVLALVNVARIDVSNVFGLTQRIDVGDPSEPLLTTTKTAFDKADGSTSTNGWKLELRFPTDGAGRNVSLYSGANDSSGTMALVVNAKWQIGGTYDSKWRHENEAQPAFALIVVGEQLTVSRQPAGSANWASWPVTTSAVNTGSVVANLLGTIDGPGHGHVIAFGEYIYDPPKTRTSIIDLTDCVGPAQYNEGGKISSPTGDALAWRVKLPVGAVFGNIEIMHGQSSAVADLFRFVVKSGGDWSDPADPILPSTNDDIFAEGPTASGNHIATLLTTGHEVLADEEFQVVYTPGATGATDGVFRLRIVDWLDPGPRSGLA